MDGDDLKFGAIALLLAATGAVGVAITLQAIAAGFTFAPAIVVPTAVLLAAARSLAPRRAWTLRLARAACPVGGAVWLLTATLIGPIGDAMVYAFGMAGASAAAWAFLDARLRPLPSQAASDVIGVGTAGWIEDVGAPPQLPVGAASGGRR